MSSDASVSVVYQSSARPGSDQPSPLTYESTSNASVYCESSQSSCHSATPNPPSKSIQGHPIHLATNSNPTVHLEIWVVLRDKKSCIVRQKQLVAGNVRRHRRTCPQPPVFVSQHSFFLSCNTTHMATSYTHTLVPLVSGVCVYMIYAYVGASEPYLYRP